MSIKEHPPQHVPVLLDAALDIMHPNQGESYLDLTAGYGGHAGAFLARTENFTDSVLVDRDEYAIEQLEPLARKGVSLLHTDFANAAKALVNQQKQFNI